MIKEKYHTSPLTPKDEKEPVEIHPTVKSPSFRLVFVYYLFGVMFARMGLLWVTGRLTDIRKARLLREVLERLGGLWIKLGQLVAMRVDVYGKVFCDELSKLQDSAFGFDPEMARKMIQKELGRPLEHIFSEFKPHPIAAASLAQVHLARLRFNQKWVVLKIQKPFTSDYLKKDMKMLKQVFGFMKTFGIQRHLMLDDMVSEMKQMFLEELDFRFEAVNLKRFRKRIKRHGIFVPEVYKQYCTKRLVVMEYVHGITMAEYIKNKKNHPERLKAWMKENQIKPKKVGALLITSVLQQLFEENLFHGDLHPGNIMLLRKNKIALIDLGSVGSTDRYLLNLYKLHIVAASNKEYQKAAEYIIMMSPSIKNRDLEPVTREIARSLRVGEMKSSLTSISKEERAKVFSDSQEEMNKAMGKFNLRPDWSFMKFGRAMATLEHTLVYLDDKMNFNKTFARYFAEAKIRTRERMKAQMADLPEVIADNARLYLNQLRRQSMPVEGTLSKINALIGGLLSGVKYALWGAFAGLIWVYFYQNYPDVVSWAHTGDGLFTRIVRGFPEMNEWALFFVILGSFLGVRKISKWINNFNMPFHPDHNF